MITATPGKDRSVDADQLSLCVDESAAGVTRIDRSIGLNKVLIIFNAQTSTPGCTDDSHGDRLSESERISHGQCNISDFNIRRCAEHDVRQIFCINLDEGDVGLRIRSDHACLELPFVAHGNDKFRGPINHVVVSYDVTVRTDDYTRAFSLLPLRPIGHLLETKAGERPTERVVFLEFRSPDHLGS